MQSGSHDEGTVCRRLNVGCGSTPTPGWLNYDNSLSVRLVAHPALVSLLARLGLLSEVHTRFIEVARLNNLRHADAAKRIPEPDGSVDVLYTCHMLEHLDRREVARFLGEARRVLRPGGILRVAVPDLAFHVDNYLRDRDADAMIEDMLVTAPRPAGLVDKLKFLLVGERHHLWMYDGSSLCRLLLGAGFKDPEVLEPGRTTIPAPGALDLAERALGTVFVEAVRT